MKDQFTDYEQSLALKELGFDEPCLAYYDTDGFKVSSNWYMNPDNKNSLFPEPHTTNNPKISAPLKQQVFRWFRDKKLSDGSINRHGEADGGYSYRWEIVHEYGVYEERHFKMGYKTYEEAEYACINELIKLIKNKL